MNRYRPAFQSLLARLVNMSSTTDRPSLSASSPPTSTPAPLPSHQHKGVSHPPPPRAAAPKGPPTVVPLSIEVADDRGGAVQGFLHLPADFHPAPPSSPSPSPSTTIATTTPPPAPTAAVLLSGAGGGVVGPSSMYLSLASKLPRLGPGIAVLRLDYRFPARDRLCGADVAAALDVLQRRYGLARFVLVGWSFGGAPAFAVGGADARVVGCAAVASQTAGTEGIGKMSPRPVLLLHGRADRMLGPACSERLYAMYGAGGDRQVVFFEGDDHALTRNAGRAEEMLCEFVLKCAEVGIGEEERRGVVEREVVKGEERVEAMKRGGDLRGGESVE